MAANLDVHIEQEAMLVFLCSAQEAGVPVETLERFAAAGYVPQPKQLKFHAAARECDTADGPSEIGYGGVRGEAKTHAAFAQVALDDCQRFPGLKFLYLRKVGKSVRESFSDLRKKVLHTIPHDYSGQSGTIRFPQSDATIILGHFKNENDIDNYLGLEYDGILIEEAHQLTEQKHKDILSCRRTSKQGWRPRTYYTFNPGGVGHAYLYQTLYLPFKNQRESETRYIKAERGDNVFLDPEYRKNLAKQKGWKKRAWYDGDMEIAAGQYFTNWRHEHVVKPTPKIVQGQRVWAAMDYGFTHPTVVYLLSESDGMVYVHDEHCECKMLPRQHAPLINAMLERNGVSLDRLDCFVAGADVFATGKDESGKTIADQYAGLGITLTVADTDRIARAGELLELLGAPDDEDEPIAPRIQIDPRCTRLAACIPLLEHDPKHSEKVRKVNADEEGEGGDDPYDALGYGLLARDERSLEGLFSAGSGAKGW
jgi:phage terminase large subunit